MQESIIFKTCTKCKIRKSITEFTLRKNRNYKPCPRCRDCHNQDRSEWRAKLSSKDLLRVIDKKARLKYKYGLSILDIEQMKENQNFICPICLKLPNKWCVDHCHKTGKVRGLLCYSCNSLLGHIENRDKMLRIRGYLGTI